MKEPSIGIVIVNYNGLKFQNDAIRSIKASTYTNYQIIVVDSGSTDGSIEALQAEFDDVHVLVQGENVGVAVGNNIGIKYGMELGLEYTLLLNNDVEIAPDLLQILVEHCDEQTIVVPKIYFYEPSNSIWFAGGALNWKKGIGDHFGWGEDDHGQYDEEKVINYAPTCCMLFHNDVIRKIGFVDETTFMYFDDTDLCVRMEKYGYVMKYIPGAKMWHKVSSSTGGLGSKLQIYYMNRNQCYYMKKHKDKMSGLTRFLIHASHMKSALIALVFPPNKNNRMIWTAYYDYLHGNMGRKDFQKK